MIYTIKEAAELAYMDEADLRKKMQNKEVKFCKIDQKVFFTFDQIQELKKIGGPYAWIDRIYERVSREAKEGKFSENNERNQ